MILVDTGFIVAALVRTDNYHQRAVGFLKQSADTLITTWPCLTEGMYLTEANGGVTAREGLLKQVESGFINLIGLNVADALRSCALMRQYADAPMDFADASLVVAAEKLNINQILTFDGHFFGYRINGNMPFHVLLR